MVRKAGLNGPPPARTTASNSSVHYSAITTSSTLLSVISSIEGFYATGIDGVDGENLAEGNNREVRDGVYDLDWMRNELEAGPPRKLEKVPVDFTTKAHQSSTIMLLLNLMLKLLINSIPVGLWTTLCCNLLFI